jgi:hypothetical protein
MIIADNEDDICQDIHTGLNQLATIIDKIGTLVRK